MADRRGAVRVVVNAVIHPGHRHRLIGVPVGRGETQRGLAHRRRRSCAGGHRHRHRAGRLGRQLHLVVFRVAGAAGLGHRHRTLRQHDAPGVVVGDGAARGGIADVRAAGVAQRQREGLVRLVDLVARHLHRHRLRGVARGKAQRAAAGGVVGARHRRVARLLAGRPVHRHRMTRGRRQGHRERQVRLARVALAHAGVARRQRGGALVVGHRHRQVPAHRAVVAAAGAVADRRGAVRVVVNAVIHPGHRHRLIGVPVGRGETQRGLAHRRRRGGARRHRHRHRAGRLGRQLHLVVGGAPGAAGLGHRHRTLRQHDAPGVVVGDGAARGGIADVRAAGIAQRQRQGLVRLVDLVARHLHRHRLRGVARGKAQRAAAGGVVGARHRRVARLLAGRPVHRHRMTRGRRQGHRERQVRLARVALAHAGVGRRQRGGALVVGHRHRQVLAHRAVVAAAGTVADRRGAVRVVVNAVIHPGHRHRLIGVPVGRGETQRGLAHRRRRSCARRHRHRHRAGRLGRQLHLVVGGAPGAAGLGHRHRTLRQHDAPGVVVGDGAARGGIADVRAAGIAQRQREGLVRLVDLVARHLHRHRLRGVARGKAQRAAAGGVVGARRRRVARLLAGRPVHRHRMTRGRRQGHRERQVRLARVALAHAGVGRRQRGGALVVGHRHRQVPAHRAVVAAAGAVADRRGAVRVVVNAVIHPGHRHRLIGVPVGRGEAQRGLAHRRRRSCARRHRHRHRAGRLGRQLHLVVFRVAGAARLGHRHRTLRQHDAPGVVVGDGAARGGIADVGAAGIAQRQRQGLVRLVDLVARHLHRHRLRGVARGKAQRAAAGGVVGARHRRVARLLAGRPVHRHRMTRGRRQGHRERQVRLARVALAHAGVARRQRGGALVVGHRHRQVLAHRAVVAAAGAVADRRGAVRVVVNAVIHPGHRHRLIGVPGGRGETQRGLAHRRRRSCAGGHRHRHRAGRLGRQLHLVVFRVAGAAGLGHRHRTLRQHDAPGVVVGDGAARGGIADVRAAGIAQRQRQGLVRLVDLVARHLHRHRLRGVARGKAQRAAAGGVVGARRRRVRSLLAGRPVHRHRMTRGRRQGHRERQVRLARVALAHAGVGRRQRGRALVVGHRHRQVLAHRAVVAAAGAVADRRGAVRVVVNAVIHPGHRHRLIGVPVGRGETQRGLAHRRRRSCAGGHRHRHRAGRLGRQLHLVVFRVAGAAGLGHRHRTLRQHDAPGVVVGDGAARGGIADVGAAGIAQRQRERLVRLVDLVARHLHRHRLRGVARGKAQRAAAGGVVGARHRRVARLLAGRPVHRHRMTRGRRQGHRERQVRLARVALAHAGVGRRQRGRALVVGHRHRQVPAHRAVVAAAGAVADRRGAVRVVVNAVIHPGHRHRLIGVPGGRGETQRGLAHRRRRSCAGGHRHRHRAGRLGRQLHLVVFRVAGAARLGHRHRTLRQHDAPGVVVGDGAARGGIADVGAAGIAQRQRQGLVRLVDLVARHLHRHRLRGVARGKAQRAAAGGVVGARRGRVRSLLAGRPVHRHRMTRGRRQGHRERQVRLARVALAHAGVGRRQRGRALVVGHRHRQVLAHRAVVAAAGAVADRRGAVRVVVNAVIHPGHRHRLIGVPVGRGETQRGLAHRRRRSCAGGHRHRHRAGRLGRQLHLVVFRVAGAARLGHRHRTLRQHDAPGVVVGDGAARGGIADVRAAGIAQRQRQGLVRLVDLVARHLHRHRLRGVARGKAQRAAAGGVVGARRRRVARLLAGRPVHRHRMTRGRRQGHRERQVRLARVALAHAGVARRQRGRALVVGHRHRQVPAHRAVVAAAGAVADRRGAVRVVVNAVIHPGHRHRLIGVPVGRGETQRGLAHRRRRSCAGGHRHRHRAGRLGRQLHLVVFRVAGAAGLGHRHRTLRQHDAPGVVVGDGAARGGIADVRAAGVAQRQREGLVRLVDLVARHLHRHRLRGVARGKAQRAAAGGVVGARRRRVARLLAGRPVHRHRMTRGRRQGHRERQVRLARVALAHAGVARRQRGGALVVGHRHRQVPAHRAVVAAAGAVADRRGAVRVVVNAVIHPGHRHRLIGVPGGRGETQLGLAHRRRRSCAGGHRHRHRAGRLGRQLHLVVGVRPAPLASVTVTVLFDSTMPRVSSSVMVIWSAVTVTPDDDPSTLIVSFASSTASLVGVSVNSFEPLAAPAAIAMLRLPTVE